MRKNEDPLVSHTMQLKRLAKKSGLTDAEAEKTVEYCALVNNDPDSVNNVHYGKGIEIMNSIIEANITPENLVLITLGETKND